MVSANCKVWSVATSKQHAFHGPRPPRTQSPGGVVDVPAIYLSIHLSIYIYIYIQYIFMCVWYVYVCVCVGVRTRGVVTDETQRGGRSGVWARGVGGVIVRHDWSCPTGGPKPVRHERPWKLHPVCPQFIAKANPTPVSKLAFVIWAEPQPFQNCSDFPQNPSTTTT